VEYRVNAVVVARAFQSVTTVTMADLPDATAFFARSSADSVGADGEIGTPRLRGSRRFCHVAAA
jgi:hypothetical protein